MIEEYIENLEKLFLDKRKKVLAKRFFAVERYSQKEKKVLEELVANNYLCEQIESNKKWYLLGKNGLALLQNNPYRWQALQQKKKLQIQEFENTILPILQKIFIHYEDQVESKWIFGFNRLTSEHKELLNDLISDSYLQETNKLFQLTPKSLKFLQQDIDSWQIILKKKEQLKRERWQTFLYKIKELQGKKALSTTLKKDFQHEFQWSMDKDLITKVALDKYILTEKGQKFLFALRPSQEIIDDLRQNFKFLENKVVNTSEIFASNDEVMDNLEIIKEDLQENFDGLLLNLQQSFHQLKEMESLIEENQVANKWKEEICSKMSSLRQQFELEKEDLKHKWLEKQKKHFDLLSERFSENKQEIHESQKNLKRELKELKQTLTGVYETIREQNHPTSSAKPTHIYENVSWEERKLSNSALKKSDVEIHDYEVEASTDEIHIDKSDPDTYDQQHADDISELHIEDDSQEPVVSTKELHVENDYDNDVDDDVDDNLKDDDVDDNLEHDDVDDVDDVDGNLEDDDNDDVEEDDVEEDDVEEDDVEEDGVEEDDVEEDDVEEDDVEEDGVEEDDVEDIDIADEIDESGVEDGDIESDIEDTEDEKSENTDLSEEDEDACPPWEREDYLENKETKTSLKETIETYETQEIEEIEANQQSNNLKTKRTKSQNTKNKKSTQEFEQENQLNKKTNNNKFDEFNEKEELHKFDKEKELEEIDVSEIHEETDEETDNSLNETEKETHKQKTSIKMEDKINQDDEIDKNQSDDNQNHEIDSNQNDDQDDEIDSTQSDDNQNHEMEMGEDFPFDDAPEDNDSNDQEDSELAQNVLQSIKNYYQLTYFQHRGLLKLGFLMDYLSEEFTVNREKIKLIIKSFAKSGEIELCPTKKTANINLENVICDGTKFYYALQLP